MTVSSETLSSAGAPDQLETRLGMLEFVDGVPTDEAVEKADDGLDFVHETERLPRWLRGTVDVRDPQGLPRRWAWTTTRS